MIKGIAQSRRNSAWHNRHTKKKAAIALHRRNVLLSRAGNGISEMRSMLEADRKYKAAQERERQRNVGIIGRLRYAGRRIFDRIKSAPNVASFHGKVA